MHALLVVSGSRDLKLDNTLLDDSSPPQLKLCDFGFAKTWEENEEANMYTHIGWVLQMATPPVLTTSCACVPGQRPEAG